ncbi:MAG: peptidoglycan editing factor PgeF [Gammaproteobacteria bacterium]|jgi:YfiH family protein
MSIMMITPAWPAPANIQAYMTLRGTEHPIEKRVHQVHGNKVLILEENTPKDIIEADACYTTLSNTPCAIRTADCLPVLICDKSGQEIAALHAGWRGLLANIIAKGLECFSAHPEDILVWLGPAIGSKVYEIGPEVYTAFTNAHPDNQQAFKPSAKPGHYFLNMHQLARLYLNRLGITQIYGEEDCTYSDAQRFYSYRRNPGETGRMMTVITKTA